MQEIQIADELGLIERARSGDGVAIDSLARRYHKPLLGFVLGRVNCAREDAEDLVQEVWARVFTELHKGVAEGGYDPGKGAFYTFVVNRYAKYFLMQYVERSRKRSMESFGSGEDEGESHVDPQVAADCPDPEMMLVAEEEQTARSSLLEECFRLTFKYGGYPHQVLAFGFSKLVYGKSTKRDSEGASKASTKRRREVEGDPRRLDSERGAEPLTDLTDSFWDEYTRGSGLDATTQLRLESYLDPTRERLGLTVAEMARDNKTFRDHHAALAARIVGDTHLREYYGSRGVNAVTDWCDKVQNRVREKLGLK